MSFDIDQDHERQRPWRGVAEELRDLLKTERAKNESLRKKLERYECEDTKRRAKEICRQPDGSSCDGPDQEWGCSIDTCPAMAQAARDIQLLAALRAKEAHEKVS